MTFEDRMQAFVRSLPTATAAEQVAGFAEFRGEFARDKRTGCSAVFWAQWLAIPRTACATCWRAASHASAQRHGSN